MSTPTSKKCLKCLVECWYFFSSPDIIYDDLDGTIHVCKIDPGAEFSAPKSNKTQDIIDWVRKYPDCTLRSGEAKLLLDKINEQAAEIVSLNNEIDALSYGENL